MPSLSLNTLIRISLKFPVHVFLSFVGFSVEEADESETLISITWHVVFGEVREYIVLYKLADTKQDVWSVVSTNISKVSLQNLHNAQKYTMQVLAYAVNGEVYASNKFNFETGKGTMLC